MSAPNVSRAALLVSRDLFFTSKVTGTADLMGIEVQVAADAQTASERLSAGDFGCVFVDLADTGLDMAAFFRSLPTGPHPPVIAFGSHVATARLQAAREAGCDHVLPRSRFSAELPELLKKHCAGAAT
jgi:CheY-like chemotaxis protein